MKCKRKLCLIDIKWKWFFSNYFSYHFGTKEEYEKSIKKIKYYMIEGLDTKQKYYYL